MRPFSKTVHILAQKIGNIVQEEVETSACDATEGKYDIGMYMSWFCFAIFNYYIVFFLNFHLNYRL